jgi:hypothetical protein
MTTASLPTHDTTAGVLRHDRVNVIRDLQDYGISFTSVPRFLEYRAPIRAGRHDRLAIF